MIGLGLVLVAFGAILRYGVTAELAGVDVNVIGVILMAVGAVGFVVGLIQRPFARTRTERHMSGDGQHVVEEQTTTTDGV